MEWYSLYASSGIWEVKISLFEGCRRRIGNRQISKLRIEPWVPEALLIAIQHDGILKMLLSFYLGIHKINGYGYKKRPIENLVYMVHIDY